MVTINTYGMIGVLDINNRTEKFDTQKMKIIISY